MKKHINYNSDKYIITKFFFVIYIFFIINKRKRINLSKTSIYTTIQTKKREKTDYLKKEL